MIIGNNFPKNNNNFTNQSFKPYTTNQDKKFKNTNQKKSPMMMEEGMKSTHFYDVTSKTDMADKSYAMLKERYQNGLITLEEINKKCNQINKLRKKG